MAILDSQGRLFGKFSILDVGAALIILMVIGGIFLLPGKTSSFAQGTPIEVDVLVRGLSSATPKELLKEGQRINVIIRNEPSGTVDLKKVEFLPRTVAVSQPDGSVKALPDPRPEMGFSNDLRMTLSGNAKITEDGPVFGNKKVKVGTSLELEGPEYNFNSTVIAIRK
ncbi:MAG: pyruvate/2-oxoglutarate dehydrogenase complex,dihydrolipoamide dehydrogenase (E3) component [Alkalinema sp. CACIAM 70d]|nr:MAG: pyruvate/2-oxoglutarate dehydrogenase complex,dihydrolipoamide dehydrogenase (E3) component [Alkalinema sp. CACIAM 70d]